MKKLKWLSRRVVLALSFFTFVALAPLAAQNNPVPLIAPPLLPTAVAPGSAGFTLTVNGTGFAAGSVVTWNGSSRATTVVSSSQLTATILASDVASIGTAAVSVVSPAPGGGTSNILFFPINQPTASVSTVETNITVGNYATAIAEGDFNADGKPDLAVLSIVSYCGVQCEGNGFVNILLGNGNGTFTVGPNIPIQTWASALTVGDFNGDGKLDLAIAYGNTFEVPTGVAILFGNGDGTFTTGPTTAGTGQTSDSIAAGDFNGDGILDLAMTNECSTTGLGCPSSSVTIFLGNGDGTFTVASAPTVGFAQQVVVGDFNGDGKLDLAIEGGEVSILLGNGDGTFIPGEVLLQASNIRAVALADFNGDGTLDFAGFINCIVYPCVSGEVSVYTGNGDGTFTAGPSFNTPLGTWTGSVGDFNQDGILDIAPASISGNGGPDSISFALGKGDELFTEGATFPAGPYPTQTAVADFNGDGKLDVATVSICADGPECTSTYDGLVAILLQTATVALTPGSLSFPTQVIGTTSYYQPVNLNNNGTTPVNIESIRATGSFAQTNSCGPTLAAGTACTINVTFTPRTKDTQTGSVVVTEDSPINSQTIPMTGLGTAMSLSPTGLGFGDQAVGTTSPPQNIVLTNAGSGPLNVTQIELTGFNAPEFGETNNCGTSVAAGKSCTIGVVFAPTFVGNVSAYVSVATNGGGGTQFVKLYGDGKFSRQ